MDQRMIQILFALLRSAICGKQVSEKQRNNYSSEMLPELLRICAKHDVIHLLVLGLKQNELIEKDDNNLEKYILKTVYRYEKIRYEYEQLCNTLEKAQISFLPLKGLVICKYYPEAWMRTSCDIDVLVHESDVKKAKSVLIEKCEYQHHMHKPHDISLFTPTGVHVELHYQLIEDGRVNESSRVLKNVWSNTAIRRGFEYWNELPDEMYYFYHIAHMAKHFEDGGCGIRPFIDLWILDNIRESNKEKRDHLLNHGHLLKFAEAARKLSRVWFGNEAYDLISEQMEYYILQGGVYGSRENHIIVHQQKEGGRYKYILSRVIIPYDRIKFHYPVLQKYPWLTPFMQVRRWCKLIFCGHLKRVTKELRYSNSISNKEAANMQIFLDNVGINENKKQ